MSFYHIRPPETTAIREYDVPKFVDLLQNKLEGEHRLGNFNIHWVAARTGVNNDELDASEAYLSPESFANVPLKDYRDTPQFTYEDDYFKFYRYVIGGFSPGEKYVPSLSRSRYLYKETNQHYEGDISYRFSILKSKQVAKAGVEFLKRHADYAWNYLPFGYTGVKRDRPLTPINEIDINLEDPLTDGIYYPNLWDIQRYEGFNENLAFFGMMDNRISKWVRLVWGLRVESFIYKEIENPGTSYYNWSSSVGAGPQKIRRVVNDEGKILPENQFSGYKELKWRYLPSVSLTITPLEDLNIRGSYAKSIVRPGLMENSKFHRFNPKLGTYQMNTEGLVSTLITHYDAKLEYYPNAGEIISAGYFYKDFLNPVEHYLGKYDSSQKVKAKIQNSKSAKVSGWEFEIRKNLSFLHSQIDFLKHFYITANLTKQNSVVEAIKIRDESMPGWTYRREVPLKQKRPLYGQVPMLYNIGLLYDGDRLGMNVAYNYTGNKVFATSGEWTLQEYEKERTQLDAQISYKFLKNKNLGVKLNLSNLLMNLSSLQERHANIYQKPRLQPKNR